MRDIRTMFVAADNLAPRFTAEVNYYLEGMRPFVRRSNRRMTFEPFDSPTSRRSCRSSANSILQRDVSWVACIAASDQRRQLIGFERYAGPESDVLILRRSWRIGDPDPYAKSDVEMLTELSKQMHAASFTGERAAVPSLTRLLARGAWSTFILFWIVVAGFVLLFWIIWQIAARL